MERLTSNNLYEIVTRLPYTEIINYCKSSRYFNQICSNDPQIRQLIYDKIDQAKMRMFKNSSIVDAAKANDVDLVDQLLNHREYKLDEIKGVTNAAFKNRNFEMIEIIQKRYRQDRIILQLATKARRIDFIVDLFNKNLFDPATENNYLIHWAQSTRNTDLMRRLLNNPRVQQTLHPQFIPMFSNML